MKAKILSLTLGLLSCFAADGYCGGCRSSFVSSQFIQAPVVFQQQFVPLQQQLVVPQFFAPQQAVILQQAAPVVIQQRIRNNRSSFSFRQNRRGGFSFRSRGF